ADRGFAFWGIMDIPDIEKSGKGLMLTPTVLRKAEPGRLWFRRSGAFSETFLVVLSGFGTVYDGSACPLLINPDTTDHCQQQGGKYHKIIRQLAFSAGTRSTCFDTGTTANFSGSLS